jgi:hypothetical protein
VGDFIDSIGRGIGGLVGDALNVIWGVIRTVYDWLHVFLPGPILPVVLGGLAFAGIMWFMFKR